jgi:hypothetical protein
MPAYMMMARCVSRGARLYASEAINGMYDSYEMMDAFVDNKQVTISDEGEIYLNTEDIDLVNNTNQ